MTNTRKPEPVADPRPGEAFEKLMPVKPDHSKKQLVSALIEAASILDGARTSLSEYSNAELMEELQRRMK